MTRNVSVDSGRLRYTQAVSVGPHVFHLDEATDVRGNDTGPQPQELLMLSEEQQQRLQIQIDTSLVVAHSPARLQKRANWSF